MTKKNFIKSLFTNLLVLTMTFVLLFIVGEVSLRIYHYLKHSAKAPETAGEFHLDERLGWRATENYKFTGILTDAADKPYAVKIETNQYGFRIFGEVNSKRKKIMVIGDSFTQGTAVSNDKTYYGLISKSLPVEIFAYGCGGYGTLQEYMILDEYVDMIKPDIIIWQFSTNDFINNDYDLELNSTCNNNGTRRPYLSSDGQIFYAVPTRYKTIRFIREYINPHSKLSAFIFKRADRLLAYLTKDMTVENDIVCEGSGHIGFKRSSLITDKIMRMVRERTPNTRILVFCGDDGNPFYDEIIKIVKQNHMDFIDGIPQAIREANKQGNTTYTADKAHWNELGHKIVAEKIIEYLNRNKIIN